MDNDNDLRERLAAVQHEIWAHWMRYLFSRTLGGNAEGVIIPNDLVIRWQRQADAPYARLAESERESDRHQADKVLAILQPYIDQLNAELAAAAQRADEYASYYHHAWDDWAMGLPVPMSFAEWSAAKSEEDELSNAQRSQP
jgi:hypothetical protein